MEILITYKQEPAFEEALKLDNLLGAGKFRVYSTYSSKNQTTYALKIFPNTLSGVTHYNKEQVLSLLQHPNIIKCIPITCDIDVFYCLLTELAPFGAFLRFATTKAFNSESLIRTYFRQLIEGIEYLHSQGIAHLDLKLDNLVLGNDYKLKIIDFDQAQSISDTKIKCGGTTGYRPLELIQNKCTNLAAVDVYSAGVILFTLIAKEFPFYEVTGQKGTRIEPYATFVKDNDKFWTDKARRQEDKSVFSDELKELLNGMMEYDPEKRMKLEEIKNSKWYQGPVVQEERVEIEMKIILDSLFVKEDAAKSTSESSECKKE